MSYIDFRQVGIFRNRLPLKVSKVDSTNEKKQLLNQIYRPTDDSLPPANDIGIFQSKETSPEVQNFIHNNLLQEQEPTVVQSALDADEDDICDGTPRRYETLNQFEKRVEDKLLKEKSERTSKRHEENLRKVLKDMNLD